MTIIEKMDGSRYDMTEYGFPILKIGPIDIVYDSENVKGRPGRNRIHRAHGVRKIQLKMLLQAKNETDTIFLDEKLAEIFDDAEDFYVYQQVSKPYEFEFPGQTSFQTAKDRIQYTPHLFKRWHVERINNDAIEWNGTAGKRVLEFETVYLPYGETPFTSLELEDKVYEWGEDMLGWGFGLNWGDSVPRYVHDTETFSINNVGNITLDPRHMPVKILLKGVFSSFVQIENLTTGDVFRLNRGLVSSDILELNGVDYLLNNQSVTGSTNKKLITFAKGINEFRITGGDVHHFEFESPFYFL